MRFLLSFCGRKTLAVLFTTSLSVLLLDLLSIALIFPFLKLFVYPDIIRSNPGLNMAYRYAGFSDTGKFVFAVGIGLVALYFIKLALKVWIKRIKFYAGNAVTFRLSSHLFAGLMNARYSIFTEQSTSEMVGVVNAHTVHSMICLESWVIILNEVSLLIFLFLVFVLIKPLISFIILLVFIFVGVVLYFGLVKRISSFGRVHSNLNLLVYKFAFAVANSIKDIKIMGLEKKFIEIFSRTWFEYSRNDSRAKTTKSIPADFSETLVFSGIIAVCLYILAAKQNFVELIPMLGVAAVSSMRVLPSFNRIISNYNEYKYYKNSLIVVEDLSNKLTQNRHDIRHIDIAFENKLEVKDLSFSYGEKRVLDAITFTINKGSSVAFVGSSGAGKSTLLDVLVGLKEPEQGVFSMDRIEFDPFGTDALRRRVGYVPQNVNLLDESVAFNISFEKKYEIEKMDQVIRMSRLSSFVSELKEGLDSNIGESAVRISGGQKQRIGIARALYRDPEILVFDEATSALDTVTEKELMDEINSFSGSKTLIIVAHRLSTVEKCDTIYLLDQGRIIAQGTHEELLRTCAAYQQMYAQQGMETGIN
jgi:ATP-binding cassette, subfamily B, bacterial PglK